MPPLFKKVLIDLWRGFQRLTKFVVLRLLPVLAILTAVWYGFIRLIVHVPIGTTPALIMVWASALILLVAFFPRLLDRIKKLKVKDFEIELQDVVKQSTIDDYLRIGDLGEERVFSEKRGWPDLMKLLTAAEANPQRPVLLVANLREDNYISIPMLFGYLYALDLVGSPVALLFISTGRRIRKLADVNKRDVIGVLKGRAALKTFTTIYPQLNSIAAQFDREGIFSQPWPGKLRSQVAFERWHTNFRGGFLETRHNQSDTLSASEVRQWFVADLNRTTIDVSLSVSDLACVRDALARQDEFIIAFEDNQLRSIVSVCRLATRISKKALTHVEHTADELK